LSFPTPVPAAGIVKTAVDANNLFAADLYTRLGNDPENAGKNIFFSPFSISSALAITYEGARANTADEIRTVFHFPNDTTVLRMGYFAVNAEINRGDANFTLRTANALWAEKNFPFLPLYTGTVTHFYAANATNLDFASHPEDSRVTINRWTEEKTNNLIRDLIPPGVIDTMTRLVITNAIYFKGTWLQQFNTTKTTEEDFHVTSGKTVRVPMMQRTDEDSVYRYAATDDLQILELPYANQSGSGLSMLVLLPREHDLSAVHRALTPANMTTLRDAMTPTRVDVYLPKFRLETEYRLDRDLAAMGMPTAFTDGADFSGMDGAKDLSISAVIHKAYVDVNEEGTEAAAATAVVIRLTSAGSGPEVFYANHPFLFLIRDNKSGAILFLGQVSDPTA
jgi:serpin B